MNTQSKRKHLKTERISAVIVLLQIILCGIYLIGRRSGNALSGPLLLGVFAFVNVVCIFLVRRKVWPKLFLAEICCFVLLNFWLLPKENDGLWGIHGHRTTTLLETAEKSPEEWVNGRGKLFALLNQTMADKTVVINSSEIKAFFNKFELYYLPGELLLEESLPLEELELPALFENYEILTFELDSTYNGKRQACYVNSESISDSDCIYILDKDEILVIVSQADFERWKEL